MFITTSRSSIRLLKKSGKTLRFIWAKNWSNIKSSWRISTISGTSWWLKRVIRRPNHRRLTTLPCNWLSISIATNSCRKERKSWKSGKNYKTNLTISYLSTKISSLLKKFLKRTLGRKSKTSRISCLGCRLKRTSSEGSASYIWTKWPIKSQTTRNSPRRSISASKWSSSGGPISVTSAKKFIPNDSNFSKSDNTSRRSRPSSPNCWTSSMKTRTFSVCPESFLRLMGRRSKSWRGGRFQT